MRTIDTENAKQIRDSMEIFCGITSRDSIDLTVAQSGDIKLVDSNVSTSIDSEKWNMRHITDLQGDGFPLDGTCDLYVDGITASLDDGKLGIRTSIGGDLSVTVTAAKYITALTLAFTNSSNGTITANGVTYQIRRIVVIPVNGTTITLTMTNGNDDTRIEVASITPGVSLEFTNDNLISCVLTLRSDLSTKDASWQVSDIEINAYWADDISDAISNMSDDVPITYYAGYDGDYSPTRYFYLSETASMKDNQITLKGEDASSKLEDSLTLQRIDTVDKTGRKSLYEWMINVIKGSGIKPNYIQASPSASGTSKTGRTALMTSTSKKDHVQNIMSLCRFDTFWPTFVDAGLPELTFTKPTGGNRNNRYPIWDIYEADCGDVAFGYDPLIGKVTSTDDYGVQSTVTRKNTWSSISKNIKIEKNEQVTKNAPSDEYYWSYKVKYKKSTVWDLPDKFAWIPNTTSKKISGKWHYKPTLYGKKMTVAKKKASISSGKTGQTLEITPITYGKIYENGTFIYPNYNRLFIRSNETGSFTFKGDPRMQPRDVFNFHRKDGTTAYVCTIEQITLTHESGGTKADVTYRKGYC